MIEFSFKKKCSKSIEVPFSLVCYFGKCHFKYFDIVCIQVYTNLVIVQHWNKYYINHGQELIGCFKGRLMQFSALIDQFKMLSLLHTASKRVCLLELFLIIRQSPKFLIFPQNFVDCFDYFIRRLVLPMIFSNTNYQI